MNKSAVPAPITSVRRNPSRFVVGVFLAVGLGIGLLPVLGSSAAPVEGQKVYIITHIDISPPPAGQVGAGVDAAATKKKGVNATTEAETLLRQFAVESRRDQVCVSFQVLRMAQNHNDKADNALRLRNRRNADFFDKVSCKVLTSQQALEIASHLNPPGQPLETKPPTDDNECPRMATIVVDCVSPR